MCGAELLTRRGVHSVVDMPLHRFDAHTWAHMFHPQLQALIDPFLGVDAFAMPQNFFLPHPHAGMSAVTLLLDDSPGGVLNRDSQGDASTIAPGDLHWTQAGSGIIHEETPSQPGQAAVGLQIFVNMARGRKTQPAAVFKVSRADMPVWAQAGVRVTVVAGRFQGLNAPMSSDARWATPVDMLDVRLDPGAPLALPLSRAKNAFLLVLKGAVRLGEQTASAHQAVVWQPAKPGEGVPAAEAMDVLDLVAGEHGAHAVLCAGVPLREPVVPHGPFVGNTREDIVGWVQAYQAGHMGHLDASFQR
jgi:hypothetical protein